MTTSTGLATIGADQLLNGVASRLIFEGPPCDSWPCWNEGECVANGTRGYSCRCLPQFVGRHCQFRIAQICGSSRCQTNSTCFLDGMEIKCPGTKYNEFFTSCDTTPCMNDGVCKEIDGKQRCVCSEPFHGQFCQFISKDWSYDWTVTEVALLFIVVFLVACAVGMICCSSSMGFYVSVPSKRYSRWEEGDFSGDEDDLIALGDIRKGAIRVSHTAETIIETDPPCGSSQQIDVVDL
ncbi:EGF-like domain protein [Necator americanus]|uniref:EGF-like domain protein n=1 Tax=Necator americanus TaxID=51031 RepID=W2U1P8_NECAM|nr:EGF-like domain protein [Necator americanus]ETN87286.1 EGF-like domain protein [Necator americanus]